MKFYGKDNEVFEVAKAKDIDFLKCEYKTAWWNMCTVQVHIAVWFVRNEKNEAVEVSRSFTLINPNTNDCTDKYNQNGYKGRTYAVTSGELVKLLKAVFKRNGEDEESVKVKETCKTEAWNKRIEELLDDQTRYFENQAFVKKANDFEKELQALLDKYDFQLKGSTSSYYDSNGADATVLVEEKEENEHLRKHAFYLAEFSDEDGEVLRFEEATIGNVREIRY